MQSRGNRRGNVFSLRVTDAERLQIERMRRAVGGPIATGPWLVWNALRSGGSTSAGGETIDEVLPSRAGSTAPGTAIPRRRGNTLPRPGSTRARRIILDLCGGSGAWSAPYRAAGYDVRLVTLPQNDVRTYRPPSHVHGILCAPPCTEFSLAKNGQARDYLAGMNCVNACLRIVQQSQPQWWALENPQGKLGHWLGPATDFFQPYEFGDAWTKRTCLWGSFAIPNRGPYVKPLGSHPNAGNPAKWAETPAGFARAFFEANQ